MFSATPARGKSTSARVHEVPVAVERSLHSPSGSPKVMTTKLAAGSKRVQQEPLFSAARDCMIGALCLEAIAGQEKEDGSFSHDSHGVLSLWNGDAR